MNRDVCEHFNPIGMCAECRPVRLCQKHLQHYVISCPTCNAEYMGMLKSKANIMRKLRQKRVDDGLVRIEMWITPKQKERVLKYVARLKRDA